MSDRIRYVLDASALLAFTAGEPGADRVAALVPEAAMSTVNWSEVLQRAVDLGVEPDGVKADLAELGLALYPFTPADAEDAAHLRGTTRAAGLSLGDRACLTLARRLATPAVTADQRWASVDVGVEIQLIR